MWLLWTSRKETWMKRDIGLKRLVATKESPAMDPADRVREREVPRMAPGC